MRSTLSLILAVALIAAAVAATAVSSAVAVETREFVVSQKAEFEQGTLQGLGIASDGYLVLSPAMTEIAKGLDAYIWRLATDGKGRIYAATGSDGKLFVIGPDGEIERTIPSHEYELFALAVDAKGRPVFAGAPNGTVQRLDGESATPLFDVPEGVVWDVNVGPKGTVYAATGERGRIYAIDPGGEVRQVYESPEAHIVSLASGPDGRLLAGTDSKGLLLSIDPQSGQAEVLFDAAEEEIAEILTLEDGSIVFGANGALESGGQNRSNGDDGDDLTLRIGPAADGPVLYRRDPTGLVTDLWRCPEQDILSMAPAGDGSVWVGTGGTGALFRVYSDGQSERVASFDESQVLSLLATKRGLLIGTGNGGAVYRLGSTGDVSGSFLSEVLDAGATSRWGTPRVNHEVSEGGSIKLRVRSGGTKDVGDSWSPWADVDFANGAPITAPPNRYVQWQLELETEKQTGREGPKVYEVAIPYLRPNRSPRVTKLTVSADSPAFSSEKGGGRGGTVTQFLQGGVKVDYTFPEMPGRGNGKFFGESVDGPWARVYRSAVWEGEDPDGDRLVYEISFRPVGEEHWTVLDEDVTQTAYTWDASAWPDGRYVIRVRADDGQDNPEEWSLSTASESLPFQVDNTPPALEDLKARIVDGEAGRHIEIAGKAVDGASRIARLEASLDGKGWKPLTSTDGILDSPVEVFDADLELEDGEAPRYVAVRARDDVGHPVVGRAQLVP